MHFIREMFDWLQMHVIKIHVHINIFILILWLLKGWLQENAFSASSYLRWALLKLSFTGNVTIIHKVTSDPITSSAGWIFSFLNVLGEE